MAMSAQDWEVLRQQRAAQLLDAARSSRLRDQAYLDQQTAYERREAEKQKAGEAKDWGNEAVQGGQMGMQYGGPWGALIGGGAGTTLGQYEGTKQRMKEGQTFPVALIKTLFDVMQPIKGALKQPGAMAAGAQLVRGDQARKNATAKSGQEQIAELQAKRGTLPGTTRQEFEESDLDEDFWKTSEERRKKREGEWM